MNPIEKKQLEQLQKEEGWIALAKLYQETIEKWQNQNVISETSDLTLKLLYMREGKVEGLREFFDNLDKQLYE